MTLNHMAFKLLHIHGVGRVGICVILLIEFNTYILL